MIDPQSSRITSAFAIDAAGVVNLQYPFRIAKSLETPEQTVTGTWQMSGKVASSDRGTHMSRMIEALEKLRTEAVSPKAMAGFTVGLVKQLDSEQVSASTEFTWFRTVKAPVSGIAAMLDHRVRLTSEAGANTANTIFMEVAAKSVCPCSKAISDRGAHNQRSLISATITVRDGHDALELDALSDLLQNSASSPVYPILKRADEKRVTEEAFDHPVFVEDIARNVANKLVDISSVASFVVHVRNLESIHAHDCFATIRHG